MKINIVSKDTNIINFCQILRELDHQVQVVNGQFPECDLCIYDSEFETQIKRSPCLKIEHVVDKKVSDNFSISYKQNVSDYYIKPPTSMSSPGVINEDFLCDVSCVNVNPEDVITLGAYLNGTKSVKVFHSAPMTLWCYCGIIDNRDANDLFVSSKCTLCPTEYHVVRVLEAGGTPVTPVNMGLPSELVYDNNLLEVLDNLMDNDPLSKSPRFDLKELRNEVIREHNPLAQWSNILQLIGLNTAGTQCKTVANHKIKTLYF